MKYFDFKITKNILPKVSDIILSNIDESLSLSEIRANSDRIQRRVNGLILRNKSELIYFCLILYKNFLDEEECLDSVKELFRYSFYNKISRIVVYSENKVTSFYMPFIPKYKGETRVLESRLNPKESISMEELIFLIEYFKYSIFLSFESGTLLEQSLKIEAIKDSLSQDTMGYKSLNEEKLSRLVSELLFYDSSYLRYDKDLEHSLDEGREFNRDRVFQHPPYHIDSDYRDAPSYKIGFDQEISNSEFLKLFQMDESTCSMFIKSNYKPQSLLGVVENYKRSLE